MSTFWIAALSATAIVPLAASGGFACWLKRRSDISFDDKTKAWQTFISLLSAMTAIIGGLLMVGKYFEEQLALERTRVEHAEKEQLLQQISRLEPRLEQKRKLYQDASKAAITLVRLEPTEIDKVGKSIDRLQFEQLYFGSLIGVESPDVESLMVDVREHLETWTKTRQKPEPAMLERAVLDLSIACDQDVKLDDAKIQALHKRLSELEAKQNGPRDADASAGDAS
jgi:hypothetical protein